MKENLKILTPFESDKIEAQQLLFSLDCLWQGKFNDPKIGATFFDCLFAEGAYLTHGVSEGGYFNNHVYKEITLPELRELAKPREYLNSEFELVVTNQPDDGWILVEGVDVVTKNPSDMCFWKTSPSTQCLSRDGKQWLLCNENMIADHLSAWGGKAKILWQRENKVKTVKGREGNAGRFLHQWAYEAFGRGEDVQHTPCERDCDWTSTSIANPISIFSAREMKFRLKPKTITIGSRTINKPISVKPAIGTVVYMPHLTSAKKVVSMIWKNDHIDYGILSKNLCHITEQDAINHTDALLELME